MESVGTLQQAIIHFKDFENCKRLMVQLRWPDGVIKCPYCGSTKLTYLAKNRVWKCYTGHPKPKFSLKTGTIFEDSPLGLDKWLPALWLVVNCKNGISSCELARDLGVTQKTAWFMAHRLRTALKDGGFEVVSGELEVDESFIGGLARNMHKDKKAKITGTGGAGKAVVMGLLDRHTSQVRIAHVPNTQAQTLQGFVRKHVQGGSYVFTDAWAGYHGLDKDYVHKVIDHAEKYVDGNVHTNRIENFWSLLKRGLKGTYVSVEPFHLFRYLDEQAFRFNNRRRGEFGRFSLALSQVANRRLTYQHLTGKDIEPSLGATN
jgi:transposase-like protein